MLAGSIAFRAARGALFLSAVLLPIASYSQTPDPKFSAPDATFNESLAAFSSAWDASDLVFTAATFAEEPATGYGQYTPRDTDTFSSDDVITVYAEPVGYGYTTSDSGFGYDLKTSFRLLNTTGQVLASQDNFAEFSGNARSRKRELSTSLSFQFGGLPAGSYTLAAVYTDKVSGKTGTISLPFSVRAGE